MVGVGIRVRVRVRVEVRLMVMVRVRCIPYSQGGKHRLRVKYSMTWL